MKRHLVFGAFAVTVVACSSEPAPAPGPTTPQSSTGTITPQPAGSPVATTPTGTTPPATTPGTTPTTPATGVCSGQATADTCYSCCDQQNAAGVAAYEALDPQYNQCVCGKCAAQCATSVCSANEMEAPEGSACEQCMETSGCDAQWEAACNANASCAALTKCYDDSGCDEKQ